jgi:capsular polysaccharide biosynthesis protein
MRAPRIAPWLLVATLTAAGAAAAAGYALTAPKRYRATAAILVSPVSADDATFAGLGLLPDANDRRTAAASAADLVTTPQVADAVRAQLGLRRSTASVLDDVHADVAGQSDVVHVTGEDSSGVGAAQLANAFVDALISQRTASFQSQLESAVHRDEQLLAAGSAGAQANELARRLAALRSFQGQPDPTLRRASTAIAPRSSSWPNLLRLVLAGAGAGLAAAVLISLLLALVRRRRPAYDRGMPPRASDDRAAEVLADRLEQRLAARESALAARERDLKQKIDELRALEVRPAAEPADDSHLVERERERALAERERQLDERVAAVTKRELAVARAAAKKPPPPPPPPEPEPEPQPEPEPEPVLPPAIRRADGGAYNLTALERLVDERGGAHAERSEEWASYLYFLRDYAAADGSLPQSFDALVEDTFGPLLA